MKTKKLPEVLDLYCKLHANIMQSHLEILERLQIIEDKLGIKQKVRVSRG